MLFNCSLSSENVTIANLYGDRDVIQFEVLTAWEVYEAAWIYDPNKVSTEMTSPQQKVLADGCWSAVQF